MREGGDGPLYRGKLVAVCGDGDSALIETLELVGHDVRVVLIHPGETLAGQETYGGRVRRAWMSKVRHRTVLEEILGDGQVDGIRVRDLETGESSTLPVAAVFTNVGRVPNTGLLRVIALADDGRIPTDVWMRTELPGLFAAGEVRVERGGPGDRGRRRRRDGGRRRAPLSGGPRHVRAGGTRAPNVRESAGSSATIRPEGGSHEDPDPVARPRGRRPHAGGAQLRCRVREHQQQQRNHRAGQRRVSRHRAPRAQQENVVAYYTRAFNDKEPEDAVDQYVGFDKPGQDLDQFG